MAYNEFIQNIIDTRGLWDVPEDGIYQNHHIIPRCMNGEPKQAIHTLKHPNLIWLTPEEHYEAHRLLYEENPNNPKLALAWHRVSVMNKEKITKEQYGAAIRARAIAGISDEHRLHLSESHTGHKESDETRKKKSEAGKAYYAVPENLNKHIANMNRPEVRTKLSESNKGKHSLTQEHKQKLLDANTNRECKPETREKISKANKGKSHTAWNKGLHTKGTRGNKGMHWYNNGIENICAFECPEGWSSGKLPVKNETGDKISKSKKGKGLGKHWYNNGVVQAYCYECPEGFTPGMLKRHKDNHKED